MVSLFSYIWKIKQEAQSDCANLRQWGAKRPIEGAYNKSLVQRKPVMTKILDKDFLWRIQASTFSRLAVWKLTNQED